MRSDFSRCVEQNNSSSCDTVKILSQKNSKFIQKLFVWILKIGSDFLESYCCHAFGT